MNYESTLTQKKRILSMKKEWAKERTKKYKQRRVEMKTKYRRPPPGKEDYVE